MIGCPYTSSMKVAFVFFLQYKIHSGTLIELLTKLSTNHNELLLQYRFLGR